MTDNKYYKEYDESISNTHNWRTISNCLPLMESYVKNSKGLKILDVGCGPGSITYDLYENYGMENEIIGLDTPPELIEKCQKLYSTDGKNKRGNIINFVQGSAYNLPFNDEEFDIVYCNQVMIHLQYPTKAINEMKRVLKKGKNLGNGEHSYIFACEAELRSLLVYPLEYQNSIENYFKTQLTKYTKINFGLSMKHVFAESEKLKSEDHKCDTPTIKLDVVPWCISDKPKRDLFASMYIARLNNKEKEIPNILELTNAWNNWALDSTSSLSIIHGFLTIIY